MGTVGKEDCCLVAVDGLVLQGRAAGEHRSSGAEVPCGQLERRACT